MALPDGARHVLAGILAGAVFLGFYFGLDLVWWLALALAVAGYFAWLIVIPRRRPLEEIQLGLRVSAADLAEASAALQDAGRRLARAAEQAPKPDGPPIARMSGNLLSIRQAIVEDPEDYRAARAFITVYLPKIVQSIETYVKLAAEAQGDARDRVAALGRNIRDFEPVIGRIHAACIENDLHALEAEVSVLSGSLERA